MMSGSNKYGRGAGRGLTRMVPPPPPPLGRGMVPLRRGAGPGKEKGRSEEASMKGRGLATKVGVIGAGSTCQEENFQLVSCGEAGAVPLYAMAIRLTPGLLETLKRVEELGESTTMKFGDNNSGHVIKVGDEEFRFSSAPEPGHLCDIFEEQRRGEDGNGLLVESGAVWRKLSVIRTLSATEKDRVKARSVEAERQLKSRKAIVLDHSNSVMKNKVATSGEVNGRRPPPMKPKREPPQKKRKVAITPPVAPPVSAPKPRVVPVANVVVPKVPKPVGPSIQESTVASSRIPSIPPAMMPPVKPKVTVSEEAGTSTSSKVLTTSQKDKVPSPVLTAGIETGGIAKATGVVSTTELRNCLITLLVDNPKGMTLKAVEKALGEAMPNVRPDKKQIEKVIKAIASFHAPGRYMLKEGVEKGVFAKPSPGSGSSPETVPMDSPALADSPALMEMACETQQETTEVHVDNGGEKAMGLPQDIRKKDDTIRNSSLPLQRGGESAMSRAIKKAGEIVRSKAEKLHPSVQDRTKVPMVSQVQNLDDGVLKESSAPLDVVEADHVSIGGDESPVMGSPGNDHEDKFHGIVGEPATEDAEKPGSPDEANPKNENSDGSDSSSSSASDSDSDSDSDSESGSGSGSGSGSDSDSEGSSSSGSEEENMDEDVDIISDDEVKTGVEVSEASKQKLKSKDTKNSTQRHEIRAQKQTSRTKDHPKKQRHKVTDVGIIPTPHGSEDVDIGDGAEVGEVSKMLGHETTEKMDYLEAMDSNVEVEVDVMSCDEGTNSPQEVSVPSPAAAKYDESAVNKIEDTVKDVEQGQDNLLAPMQPKSGSESDHSIEEYETRAENSGVRGARVAKVKGDQKEDVIEAVDRKVEHGENIPSPQMKGSNGTKFTEIRSNADKESRIETGSSGILSKGHDVSDVQLRTKESLVSSVKLDNVQKSLLGTPPMMANRDVSTRLKVVESKRKEVDSMGRLGKSLESGEIQEKRSEVHRVPQRSNKVGEVAGRSGKSWEASLKTAGDIETAVKSSEGIVKSSKLSEEPGLIGKGPDVREAHTLDWAGKLSHGDVLERPEVQRRQNREAGVLGKPGKGSEFLGRMKEHDPSSGMTREKDSNFLARTGKDTKQLKKPFEKSDGLRRGDLSERAGPAFEVGDKLVKDMEMQRRQLKDVEAAGRTSIDNEANTGKLNKTDTDTLDGKSFIHEEGNDAAVAKDKESRGNSDLELGELRDIVAGEDLRAKENSSKGRESFDHSSRPLNKMHASPEKDKSRNFGRSGMDPKKVGLGDLKKNQSAKKDFQKVEVSLPFRETTRPTFGVQNLPTVQDERLETSSSRAVEVTKSRAMVSDTYEKPLDGRSGKRPAEEGGHVDHGRPLKRSAVEQSQVVAPLVRGQPDVALNKQDKGGPVLDTAGKTFAGDVLKVIPPEGLNQMPPNLIKTGGENGRVQGLKESVEKRGSMLDGKQKMTAGLLGPGSKRETTGADVRGNGKKRSAPTSTAQGREFFAPYEKRAPDVKGPILHHDQYLEYCKEYNDKYPVYVRLNTVLESDKEDFECFSRDINTAKSNEDKVRLGSIYGKVRNDYLQCRKRFKRMQKTFCLLHDELRIMKQRCKEYAEKVGQG